MWVWFNQICFYKRWLTPVLTECSWVIFPASGRNATQAQCLMDRGRKESFQRGLVIAFPQKYAFTQEAQVPGWMTDEYLSGAFPSNTRSVWPTSCSYQYVVALGLPTGCTKRQTVCWALCTVIVQPVFAILITYITETLMVPGVGDWITEAKPDARPHSIAASISSIAISWECSGCRGCQSECFTQ